MSHPEFADETAFEPRRPALVAAAVFILAALTLCWPMLAGRWLLGDDQYVAGYGFRLFGAEMFRATGRIPEWNPYLFGGLPYIAAQHGDVFYPTAWLRWFLPIDTAMNVGFFAHIALAGACMYALLRTLRLKWTGAVVGGLAYELSGIVASMVRPGHDGKLYVSALAPLLLLSLVSAIRDRRPWGYGLLALTVGLGMLSPHYQMTYYLLVAGAVWTLYLVFLDPERPAEIRWPRELAIAFGAVLLGLAIAAIQVLPFLQYIPYSPRAAGGPSGGWEYATMFSMPPEELMTGVLPQFNGVLDAYWGRNFFKLHTEYLGALVVVLAVLGVGDKSRRRLVTALGAIALLFLLVSFGGHSPFYYLWYEVMPMMKKVRAPGMAFFLVALPIAAFAAIGADRLLRRDLPLRALLLPLATLGGVALLGVAGVLQAVATVLAGAEQAARVAANEAALRAGALRLLLVVLAGGGILWAVWRGKLRGGLAAAALAVAVAGDLWSIDRLFFEFRGPASEIFRDDAVTAKLRAEPQPFRVLDAGVYQGSYLMAHNIQTMLGYHGNEVRFYDELLGGKGQWRFAGSPALLDLLAVRFLLLPAAQAVPGFHQVLGPVTTTPGTPAVLMERDTVPPYVRVIPGAAQLADDQVVPTVIDPRFPYAAIALYPDTVSGLMPEPIRGGQPPAPVAVRPTLAEWGPGRMRIELQGTAVKPAYLLVAETWYPDWHAEVDGKPVAVHRADYALLSVALPPGARQVTFSFASPAYARGKLVTLAAVIVTCVLLAAPWWPRRRSAAHA
ncbi:MAG TPA: YfhO family protein [Gemmatimonadales bacterium]|nr:YfhO family protein [Gemmatimonadales bacterium]